MRINNRRLKLSSFLIIIFIFILIVIGTVSVILVSCNKSYSYRTKKSDMASIDRPYKTPLEKEKIKELLTFIDWLKANDAKGYIGEFGWPNNSDAEKWGTLATRWFETANYYSLWTSIWATGAWWGDYKLAVYGGESHGGNLSIANSQATVLEAAIKKYPNSSNGINLAGMEFGNPTSKNLGSPGEDYFYESEANYSFLAARGIKVIRMPVSWERIEPVLGGELSVSEIKAINSSLSYAKKYGMKVILDLHNYGVYNTGNETYTLGKTDGLDRMLSDTWIKLSNEFKNNPAILGYDIMNEPHDLGNGKYKTAAEQWENTSQNILTSIRDCGDDHLVFISGYDWSSVARWTVNHDNGWIKDPKNNFRYEAHHYWDSNGSGIYAESYDVELKRAK